MFARQTGFENIVVSAKCNFLGYWNSFQSEKIKKCPKIGSVFDSQVKQIENIYFVI